MYSLTDHIGAEGRFLSAALRTCAAIFLLMLALPLAAQNNDAILYTVKPGDTLLGLSGRYFTNIPTVQTSIASVQRANGIGNADRIRTGMIIKIPRSVLRYAETQGQLLGWRGDVRIWSGGSSMAPQKSQSIRESMIIETGTESSAAIALTNGSRISIPSQSRVLIVQMREYVLGKSIDYDVSVLKGRLETSAAKLTNPDSRYRVRTPTAVTAVRGTEFRVKFSGDDTTAGRSATEVSDGDVGVAIAQKPEPEALKKGEAVAVASDGGVKRGILIDPPTLAPTSRLQTAADIRFAVAGPAGAVRYRGQLSRDASGIDMVAEASSDTPVLPFANVDDGKYFLRLTAENADGFEGFARTYQITRAQTGLTSSVARSDDGGIKFAWMPVGKGAVADKNVRYRFQLRSKTASSPPLIDRTGIQDTALTVAALPAGTWVWRVGISRVIDGERVEYWTAAEELVIDTK